MLLSHRGWDIGALAVARGLAKAMNLPLHFSTTTRLLVDLNRSLHVKGLWSEWSKGLSRADKGKIIELYYQPYREHVMDQLSQLVTQGNRVLHLSIHSFTPTLDGETRNAEIGVLYDPTRAFEARIAKDLATTIRWQNTSLRVRRNYPYLGYNDGFTTTLRHHLPATHYAGIEIETRQDEITSLTGQIRYIGIYKRAIESL